MAQRRDFITRCLYGLAGLGIVPAISKAADKQKLDPDLVRDFVAASHNNPEKVKQLWQQEPRLVYASHDLGGGDFESGIEAAGHVGDRDIAAFLLEKGARINFFTLCMLGELELVQGILKRNPNMLNAKGPHGLTPLHHANKGGQPAAGVKALLESLGARETKLPL